MVSPITTHLSYLVEEIGSRPIGSEENYRTAEYIQNVFRSSGLFAAEQRFDCPSWVVNAAHIEVEGSHYNVIANSFTPGCDVISTTVSVGTLAELESVDLEGKIAVLYGELVRIGFIAKSFKMYNPEINQRLISLLESKRPAAIITVANTTENILPLINDWDFKIPSITIHPRMALSLMENSSSVRIKIDANIKTGHSSNVFGTRNGAHKEKIVVCAHYDTAFDCPGAVDNSTGLAVLLSLAEILGKAELSCGLEFISFSGEEFAAIGDQVYLNSNPDFENVLAVINVDGVGQKLGNNTITAMGGSNEFEQHVRRIKGDFPSILWSEPWYESDHTTFLMKGVPAVALNSLGIKDIYHSQKDQLHWVSPAKLEEARTIVLQLVHSLQDKSTKWCRHQS